MNSNSLPKLLRNAGAMLLISSGVIFMLEGWTALTSVGKFLTFLGFALLLGTLGLFCSRILKEQKGARTLLGLAAATGAVHFSQLGAMIYSRIDPSSLTRLPSYLVFQPENPATILMLLLLTVTVLAPVAFLAFSALCRPFAKGMSVQFCLYNALLLFPTRDAGLALAVTAAALMIGLHEEIKTYPMDPVSRTLEGWLARAILITPVLTLVGRSLFYPMPDGIQGLFYMLAAAGLFLVVPQAPVRRTMASFSQILSVLPLSIGWFKIVDAIPGLQGSQGSIPMILISWSLIVMSVGAISNQKANRSWAAWIGAFATLIALFQSPDLGLASLLVLNGLGIGIIGIQNRERACLAAGAASALIGLAYDVRLSLDFYRFNPWMSLGILGLAILLGSSYLERNQDKIGRIWSGLKNRERGWE